MSEDIASQASCIPNFYKGKTIFITGVTGFLGKVLLEKLLRSCPEIHRVYAMVRPKKGQSAKERVEAILKSELFSKLKESMPDLTDRIVPVVGDLLEPRLGLSDEHEQMLIRDTNIVFHSAATVKFDEELKLSVQMNVLGVRKIVELGKKMKNLEALIHVSTAYANCDRDHVKEMVYDPPLHPCKLIDAVEWMDEDAIGALTEKLIGERPNTYTYTKAIAEYLFLEEGDGLPIAIIRPSIVGASYAEPVPGWVDSLNGPTGLMAAVGKGFLNIMCGDRYVVADVIPVDTVTNAMIAVGWYTAVEKPHEKMVYNVTTGQINGMTWGMFEQFIKDYFLTKPCTKIVRVPNPRFTYSAFWHDFVKFVDQIMPAHIMDFFLWITGKKPVFVRIQDRLAKAVGSLQFFTMKEWHFYNDNLLMLLNKMSEADKQEFAFDPRSIDWKRYIDNYCQGVQTYVLKEDLSQQPRAKRALERLRQIHMLLKVLACVVIWRLLVKRVPVFQSLWNLLLGWVQFLFVKVPSLARSS